MKVRHYGRPKDWVEAKEVKEFIKTICGRIIAKQGATDYILNGSELVKFIEDKAADVLGGISE